MKVGFIGTGNMGKPMAANLLKAGHELVVHDVRREACAELVEAGARWGDTPREVAQASEVVITSLPGPKEVREVALGEKGILKGARAGGLYIDMSTNSPTLVKEIAAKAKEKGVRVLDAPVSGGVRGAKKGTLSIMVGGSGEDFERAKGLFQAMGERVFHVGEVGMGNVAKLCNNLLALSNSLVALEGMLMGVKGGFEPQKLYEVIHESSGNSRAFENFIPWVVFRGRFDPPAFAIDLAAKDLTLITEYARELKVPTPLGEAALRILKEAREKGLGGKDVGAVITLMEAVAGVEVRTPQPQG